VRTDERDTVEVAQPRRTQPRGQTVCALLELPVRVAAVALHDRDLVGKYLGAAPPKRPRRPPPAVPPRPPSARRHPPSPPGRPPASAFLPRHESSSLPGRDYSLALRRDAPGRPARSLSVARGRGGSRAAPRRGGPVPRASRGADRSPPRAPGACPRSGHSR